MPNVLFINGIKDDGRVRVNKIIDNNILQFLNEGTCNVCNMLDTDKFDKSILLLDSNPVQNINIGEVDVVFNQISDPDSHEIAIAKAKAVCEQIKKPVHCINHPDKIINTSREHLHGLLKETDDIVIPETIRFNPVSASMVAEMIERHGWPYPILIRKTGDHNAKSLVLLESAEDISRLHPSYFSHECYLTEFIDYSDDKGVFTKYRFVSVNGNVFIRHIMYGDQWEIHHHVRRQFMTKNSEYFTLEKDTMASFENGLRIKVEKPMRKIYDAIGLDYFGVDCSIDKQGRLIIFEANANMNLLYNPYPKPNAWQAQVDAIHDALIEMILGFASNNTAASRTIN